MKFAAKIGLSVIVAALIVTPLLGLAIFVNARDVVERRIVADTIALAHTLMRDIDQTLYIAHRDIRMIADSELLEEALSAPRTGEKEALGGDGMTRWLSEMIHLTGPWKSLTVFDAGGNVVATSEPAGVCAQVAACPLSAVAFEAALKGAVYYSDLVVSDITGHPTVIFAAPVFREPERDAVIGVTVGYFVWATILQMLDGANTDSIDGLHLFNRDGLTIATPTAYRDHILKMRVAKVDMPAEEHAGYSADSVPTHKGRGKMLAVRVIQEGRYGYLGNGWGLQLETPRERAFAPVRRMAWNTVGMVIAALAFLAAMMSAVGGRFIRPLSELAQTARHIGRGNLDMRVAVITDDEVGDVARSLNAMAEDLAQTVVTKDQLEVLVAERTEALRKARDELESRVEERTGELKESESRLKFLVSSSPAVIYTAKAEGDYAATFITENIRACLSG